MSRKMTKQGNLRNIREAPHKAVGLDWDAIRKARAERLDEEIARGVDNAETREHQLPEPEQWQRVVDRLNKRIYEAPTRDVSTNKEASAKGGRVGGPRVDSEKIVRLYVEEGLSPDQIAAEMKINSGTAIKWLKEAKVFDPSKFRKGFNGKRGVPPKKDKCWRGHDLTEEGATTQRFKDGKKDGRSCVKCQRIRARENWHKNRNNSSSS